VKVASGPLHLTDRSCCFESDFSTYRFCAWKKWP